MKTSKLIARILTAKKLSELRLFGPQLHIVWFSALVLSALMQNARADSGTWLADPFDNNWNNPANGSSGTVPDFDDTASFSQSNTTELTVTDVASIAGIIFDAGASSYTVTPSVAVGASIDSVGDIVNDSDNPQSFVLGSDGQGVGTYFGMTNFDNRKMPTVGDRITFAVKGGPSEAQFLGFASAGRATFMNEAGTSSGQLGGLTGFFLDATAGNSTIINQGARVRGAGGGFAIFQQSHQHAGKATLIAQGGSNRGGGGYFLFYDQSTGDTARVELFGNGYLDVSQRNNNGVFTIGSLEGDGLAYLGALTLSIGSNGLSTVFSGVLQDGGLNPKRGGAVEKIGSGILSLSGPNVYTGGTTVANGTLIVSNATGSGTGTGLVQVNAGTLGGSGIISGAVTIGSGAFLTPGVKSNKQLTLTIQSGLTFNSDSTYKCTFKARSNRVRSDVMVSNGVTINTGASFVFSGMTQADLRPGLTLTVISNTSASPISGTFANLPDGGVINVSGHNFQASYEGGDGNDLTLTVVP